MAHNIIRSCISQSLNTLGAVCELCFEQFVEGAEALEILSLRLMKNFSRLLTSFFFPRILLTLSLYFLSPVNSDSLVFMLFHACWSSERALHLNSLSRLKWDLWYFNRPAVTPQPELKP